MEHDYRRHAGTTHAAFGEHERALEFLEQAAGKAANHEPDEGFTFAFHSADFYLLS
jgi:hypothetical protein